jgi:hypothetical protein
MPPPWVIWLIALFAAACFAAGLIGAGALLYAVALCQRTTGQVVRFEASRSADDTSAVPVVAYRVGGEAYEVRAAASTPRCTTWAIYYPPARPAAGRVVTGCEWVAVAGAFAAGAAFFLTAWLFRRL